MKREREYLSYGEEYNAEKRKRRSKIIFPVILRLLGRNQMGKRGRGLKFWERKSRFEEEKRDEEEYQVVGNSDGKNPGSYPFGTFLQMIFRISQAFCKVLN